MDAPTKKPDDPPPQSDDIIMSWNDIDDEAVSFTIPRFIVKRKSIMVAGAESVGKSALLQGVCNMLGYGETWFDGTPLERSLCFYVTNESREEMKLRQRAWARMYGHPESPQMQDNLILIRVESRQFDHEVERKRGRSTHSETRTKFDLLDLSSVQKLIATCKRYMAARRLPCGAVVFDTLTSLLPTKMDDDVARIVTAHMDLTANELVTCCIGVQHTWRSDSEKHIGPYSLSANLHGTFIATGGLTHSNDGTPIMRTVLRCKRLKNTNDKFALDFVGTVVPLGLDDKGKLVDAVVMRCTGYTSGNKGSDSVAARRAWIGQCLPSGRTASLGALCKLCDWGRGTPQYEWIREAIPTEWITVVLSNGETRELRRIPRGKFESVECRTPDPPVTPAETVDPVHEPETKKKHRGGKRSNSGRKFGPIHVGTMNADEFRAALDQPLGDDRHAEFVAVIQRMKDSGADVTDLGERLIAQINGLANGGVEGMRRSTRFFARHNTARTILTGMALHVRQQDAKNKAKPDGPPPTEGE